MKVKSKKRLPMWNSYCGLPCDVWEKLNAGETVEMDIIPKPAIPFLEIIKSVKKPKEK